LSSNDTTLRFYNDLADLYHLVYEDWPSRVERQGQILSDLIRFHWPAATNITDVACGIGTQALGLAQHGFQIAASDLSVRAVERANGEASKREVVMSARVDDMRELRSHADESADVVIACDNAIPHLLTDDEIRTSFRAFHRVTRPGGGCIISVRDYDRIERVGRQLFPFGVRSSGEDLVSLFQFWDFESPTTYKLNFYFVFDNGRRVETRVFRARYYAVSIDTLMRLMTEAGFRDVRRIDDVFFQPLILGMTLK
jgi:SAM-dependent methyltransferase